MLILDRFEGEHAYIEGPEGVFSVERALLDAQAREGDVLLLLNGRYVTDEEATSARRARLSKLLGRLKR